MEIRLMASSPALDQDTANISFRIAPIDFQPILSTYIQSLAVWMLRKSCHTVGKLRKSVATLLQVRFNLPSMRYNRDSLPRSQAPPQIYNYISFFLFISFQVRWNWLTNTNNNFICCTHWKFYFQRKHYYIPNIKKKLPKK